MMRFADTADHTAIALALTQSWREATPQNEIGWLLQAAEDLAHDNALSFKGGPFGALIVDLPRRLVVGAAANHATLWHDPTAHAEVLALRAAHEARSDLSGCMLITSCECCPMCLAATFQSGIRHIHYHATRAQAAAAGFADAAQYDLIAQPLHAQATQVMPDDARYAEALRQLGTHIAVVLMPGVEGLHAIGQSDGTEAPDLTATPCVHALRHACESWGSPRLPPGSRLICRHAPHPLSLLAADWANLGHSGDLDDDRKDPGAILYFEPTPGQTPGFGANEMWSALRRPESAGMTRTHTPLPESTAFPAWVLNLDKLQRY